MVCRVTLITEWQLEFVQLRKRIRFLTVRLKGYHASACLQSGLAKWQYSAMRSKLVQTGSRPGPRT